jgi:hypothetical protein
VRSRVETEETAQHDLEGAGTEAFLGHEVEGAFLAGVLLRVLGVE